MGSFLEGHGDILRGNRCLIGLSNHKNTNVDDPTCRGNPRHCTSKNYHYLVNFTGASIGDDDDDERPIVGGLWGGCQDSHVTLTGNEYYTPDGTAMIGCGEDAFTLADAAKEFGLEVGSTSSLFPNEETIVGWAESIMMQ